MNYDFDFDLICFHQQTKVLAAYMEEVAKIE